jgi:hypothetical protein
MKTVSPLRNKLRASETSYQELGIVDQIMPEGRDSAMAVYSTRNKLLCA